MISITRLWNGQSHEHDALRYGIAGKPGEKGFHASKTAGERRPIVVWNCTRKCNLKCVHCYTDSENQNYPGELTTAEARAFIDSVAAFNIPTLLFSGGEPLMRPDVLDLMRYASDRGLRTVISTNGLLLTADKAKTLKSIGLIYAGISLDGVEEVNDRFRGQKGAFKKALEAFHNAIDAGLKAGLRMTLTKVNTQSLPQIFDLLEEHKIPRACFYHLAYAGRGRALESQDLTHAETRKAIDVIIDRSEDLHRRGVLMDILTVDNHVDGVYLYLKMKKRDPAKAETIRKLIEWNGGGAHSTGVGIASVDWAGNVHPDQFWMDHTFGNVKERAFGDIWQDLSDPLMKGLKDRLPLLRGKCGKCAFLKACGGSLRVRAFRRFNDPWAEDPACYITEGELNAGELAH